MFETGKIIDNFIEQNEIAFLYWAFGALIALILLFFLSRLIRNVVGGRVRQVEEFGMDFDAVADMLDKGLLSPEEAKRVKSVLGRHFSKFYERDDESAGESVAQLEAEMAAGADEPMPPGAPARRSPEQAAPAGAPAQVPPKLSTATPQEPSSEAPPDEETAELPLDVLDMYRAGMITDEELVALRRFYAARARRAK
ncbi:hypothetical protein AMJ85_08670 [candidate division BRC1 bacterium SM23_51]|nr:MAG: hypothetical protein AMJ85_08670 [candidate division BRC1 bacterium SM23_51]